MQELKNKLITRVKTSFPDAVEKDHQGNRLDFSIRKEAIPSILLYMKEEMGYKHLSHISCVDWVEEGEFELIFIVWSPVEKIKIFVHTRVNRDHPEMENIDMIWRQANTYEREMKEMYGIQFTGLVAPEEFLLEDWEDIPPMRRDFDTGAYVDKTFYERPGREDAKDVREEIAKKTGEDLPDFVKKYSR